MSFPNGRLPVSSIARWIAAERSSRSSELFGVTNMRWIGSPELGCRPTNASRILGLLDAVSS
jgi:hypothetical protein